MKFIVYTTVEPRFDMRHLPSIRAWLENREGEWLWTTMQRKAYRFQTKADADKLAGSYRTAHVEEVP